MSQVRWMVPSLISLLAVALTSCSAVPVATPHSPAATTSSQPAWLDGAESLENSVYQSTVGDLIWLPQGVRSTVDADQPNLVIVSGLADQSSQVLAFLELSLPDLGWRISDRSPEALMFEQAPWQGAFVIVDDQWALTARNDS